MFGNILHMIFCIPGYTNVNYWLGIPYAATTSGENKWQPPQPRPAWSGILPCTEFAAGCFSGHHNPDVPAVTSYDCLNLNVYAPTSGNQGSLLPVMVFLHGGGFAEGSNQGPFGMYKGSNIASVHNVIVVAINYRLDVFGWLALGSDDINGNFGLMDQVFALNWIQRNIAAFGGDKSQITVFGESAGAMSVGILLTTEKARGLFQRAIMESNPGAYNYHNISEAAIYGAEFCRLMDCQVQIPVQSQNQAHHSTFTGCDVTCLRKIDDEQSILHAWNKAVGNITDFIQANLNHILDGLLPSIPTVDLDWIPGEPVSMWNSGKYWAFEEKVPIMMGTNAGEGETFIYMASDTPVSNLLVPLAYDAFFDFNTTVAGLVAQQDRYSWLNAADGREPISRMLTDYWFRCGSEQVLAAQHAANANVFQYKYSHIYSNSSIFVQFGLPPVCETIACHATELPFVFNNVPSFAHFQPDESVLSARMMSYWTNFAKTGDPNNDGSDSHITNTKISSLTNWPAWTPLDKLSLVFSNGTEATTESTLSLCGFWDEVGYFF
jgi:acetylcholinesterase/cholinesterase